VTLSDPSLGINQVVTFEQVLISVISRSVLLLCSDHLLACIRGRGLLASGADEINFAHTAEGNEDVVAPSNQLYLAQPSFRSKRLRAILLL
jgi:hypothetical protein